MKKIIGVVIGTLLIGSLTACGASKGFDPSNSISVVSREDGSGTRGAFIELFGVQEKDKDGNKIDNTTTSAMVTNNTSAMMTTVAGDVNAIGYSSLGSLNDTVKALKIDGVEVSATTIKDGSYKISRPFNVVLPKKVTEQTKDFIAFILSKDGQTVVEDAGYVAVADSAAAYEKSDVEGKIVIAGSSSVTPVMEKLKEAYEKVNSKVEIEVQESDSTTGITSAIDGTCDLGMASRELDQSETDKGITATEIALDGIAVIVNKENTMDTISAEQVKDIYVGNAMVWSDVIK